MKSIMMFSLVVISLMSFSQTLITPINFIENEYNKQRVIEYIKIKVKEDYTSIGMGDPSTLRMMEKTELEAFKELTTVTNTALLKQIIETYCEIGMCNYSTFLLMYNEENKASNETLKW